MYYSLFSTKRVYIFIAIIFLSNMLKTTSIFSQRLVTGEINLEAIWIGSNDS